MPVDTTPHSAVTFDEVLRANTDQSVRWNDKISYFSTPPMAEEDLRHYIHDPLTALPPLVQQQLPPLLIALVPYLEKADLEASVRVSFAPAPVGASVPSFKGTPDKGRVPLFFATKDEEVSEYHFSLYHLLAELMAESWTKDAAARFLGLVKEELAANVNGEIDEKSWQMKQALSERRPTKDSKALRDYAKQAFIDTATLYLHGICCDIDVETGPRQMPSRYVRKRLEALHALYPPPAGHAVFPEQLTKGRSGARA